MTNCTQKLKYTVRLQKVIFVTKGLSQGCLTSSTLFKIFIAEV
jgi:hypothetical protein